MGVFGKARTSVRSLGQRLKTPPRTGRAFDFAMLSHVGRVRQGNEDTCAVLPEAGAFVVCDGMGGAAAGEVASRMAADTFLRTLKPRFEVAPRTATPDVRLDAAILAANQAVYDYAQRQPELRGMGTTLVALLLEVRPGDERPVLTLAHVGDSRCYLMRAGVLAQLTLDHSLVEEQLRLGEITADEAATHPMRNIITRAVGSQAIVEPEIQHLDPQPGDLYLLASDGLTRELTDAQIATIVSRAQARDQLAPETRTDSLERLSQTLVNEANDHGGQDNITVLLVSIL